MVLPLLLRRHIALLLRRCVAISSPDWPSYRPALSDLKTLNETVMRLLYMLPVMLMDESLIEHGIGFAALVCA